MLGKGSGKIIQVGNPAALLRLYRDYLIQIIVYRLYKDTLTQSFKPVGTVCRYAVRIFVYDLLPYERNDHKIYPYPELLYNVEDQHRPVVVVPVKDAHVRIDAGFNKGALHLTVQHAVTVIEQAVKKVLCRILAPLHKPVGFRKCFGDDLKIESG